jgi:hypothetical protein
MKEFVANPSGNATQGKISLPINIGEIRRGWLSGEEISRQKRHRGCTFTPLMCIHAKVARFFKPKSSTRITLVVVVVVPKSWRMTQSPDFLARSALESIQVAAKIVWHPKLR